MAEEALGILLHGPAGSGKSTLALSGFHPILMMDIERASRFIQLRKIKWDPMRDAPPVYNGQWDVCVVKTRNWETAQKVVEWLRSGQHPFRTVSVDSISELQAKAMESVNGRNQMQTQHWGKLLQYMGSFLRDLRDLTDDEDNPLQILTLIATSKDYDGTFKPYLQGSIASQVPYLFDMTAYLYVNQAADPATGEVGEHRFLFTGNHPQYEAKSRVPNVPPTIMDPNLTEIMFNIFPHLREEAAATAAPVEAVASVEAPAPADPVEIPAAPVFAKSSNDEFDEDELDLPSN